MITVPLPSTIGMIGIGTKKQDSRHPQEPEYL
jgi:hypothetical protein